MSEKSILVLVTTEIDIQKVVDYLESMNNLSPLIFSWSKEIQEDLFSFGYKSEVIVEQFTPIELNRFEDISFNWFKEWSNIPIYQNNNIKDILLFEEICLWWFVESHPLYYSYIKERHKTFQMLLSLTSRIKPDELYIQTDQDWMINLCNSLSIDSNFNLISVKLKNTESSLIKKILKKFPNIPLWIKGIVRKNWLNKHRKPINLEEDSKQEKLTIITPEREWRSIFDIKKNTPRKGIVLVDQVIQKLEENNYEISNLVNNDWGTNFGLEILEEISDTYPSNRLTIPEQWEFGSINGKAKKHKKKIKKLMSKILKTETFRNSFNSNGFNLYSIFKDGFIDVFNRLIPNAIRSIGIIQNYIENNRPDIFLLPCEYCSFYGYAAIALSKKYNIPTIAVQHGFILSDSIEYILTTNDLQSEETSKKQIIPTKLCIFGSFTEDVISKYNLYPKSSIQITGSPYYDNYPEIKKNHKQNEIRKELSISEDKIVVTFMTQAFQSIKLRKELFKLVSSAFQELNNYILIIKPHPSEDTKLLQNWLEETKLSNIHILDKNVLTSKLLLESNLMITATSTTALESLILETPLIILSPNELLSPIPYVKEGAALNATDTKELIENIKKLTKKSILKEMEFKRKDFCNRHIYEVDGKSYLRIFEIIDSLKKSS
ncbi:MAG: CDP-glycerol glycerophosphotransferase family protein [Candidatus Ranarchaeia archaeon]